MSLKNKVLILLVGLALILSADVKTGGEKSSASSIVVSGGVNAGFLGWSEEITEFIGSATANDDGNFWWGNAFISLEATVADNVKGKVTLENRNFTTAAGFGAYTDVFGNGATLTLNFKEAYITAGEFLSEYLTFSIGFQNLAYSLRGDGNYFLVNLQRSNSPWVTSIAEGAFGPGPGGTRGWNPSPAGIKFTFGKNDTPWKLDLFYFIPAFDTTLFAGGGSDGATAETDESILGAVFDYNFGEKNLFTVGIFGFGQDQWLNSIWTFGAGVDYFFKFGNGELEAYTEWYFQTGDFSATLDQSAFGGYAGLRYTFETANVRPYIDASFWWISGDNTAADADQEQFLSYRYLGNSTLILEHNFYGLDVRANYWAIKAELGANFNLRREKDFTASVSYNIFNLVEEEDPGTPDDLGSEVDVKLTWNYNDSLSFAAAAGFLFGSDVLDATAITGGTIADDNASLYIFETRLRF